MNGLQRRYDFFEILEKHNGPPKLRPLSYDAMTMLRSPLYVKYAEQLRNESQNMNQRILHQHEYDISMRRLASERDLPHDLLHNIAGNFDDDPDDDDFGSGGLGQGPFAASSQTTQRERKQRQ